MRPVLEVADIFRRHGEAFRAAQGDLLPGAQRRVMAAIEACRTAALGGHVERCDRCGEIRVAYNSCRNRHCPKCQGLARLQWLDDRRAALLPVPYFHLVFTLPRPWRRSPCKTRPSSTTSCSRPRPRRSAIGADPSIWGRDRLDRHPAHLGADAHPSPARPLHRPGRRLGPDGRLIACRAGFFLPVRVLSRLYRRLFLERLQAAFEAGELNFFGHLASSRDPSHVWRASPPPQRRMGRLCQATVRRAPAGARLSRPLHPPRCHRQQPPARAARTATFVSAGKTTAGATRPRR